MEKSVKENKKLTLFALSKIFLICAFFVEQIFHPALGDNFADYLECLFPVSILIFIIGGFFVTEKNLNVYHKVCKLLIPLRIVFGETGLILYMYFEDSLYLLRTEQMSFGELLSVEDGFLFFNLLPYIVKVIFESFALICITDHKINNLDCEKNLKNNKNFLKSSLFYGLLCSTDMIYMYVVRLDALSTSEGITDILCLFIPGLIYIVFTLCIIFFEKIILVKILKYSFIAVTFVIALSGAIGVLMKNFSYIGFSYIDVCNIINILSTLAFSFVITETGELCFSDKMHKKPEA